MHTRGWVGRLARRVAILSALLPAVAAGQTVIVDAGHSLARPGAVSASGRGEWHYNRALAQAVSDRLERAGFSVVRVAHDGADVALRQRPAAHADFFLSLHHDSIQQQFLDAGRAREFGGFSVFVSADNAAYAASLSCARTIGAALGASGERPSLYHAMPIAGENRPLVDAARGVHRFDGLAVLRAARMPAVLVEAGVIVNPDEDARLAAPSTVSRLSDAIAAGVYACLRPVR